jgi:hypothetical protein
MKYYYPYKRIPKGVKIAIKTIKDEIIKQGIDINNIKLKWEDELETYYFYVTVKTPSQDSIVKYFSENRTLLITEVAHTNNIKRSQVPFIYFKYTYDNI